MTGWRPTEALARAVAVAVVGLAVSVATGEPALLVIVTPFAAAALALARRPSGSPRATTDLDHLSLSEGQGTTSRLRLTHDEDVEQVTRLLVRGSHVLARPSHGRTLFWHRPGDEHDLELSPRRWGVRQLGEEQVGLTSAWSGFRWGPVDQPGSRMRVLPAAPPYASGGSAPQPRGLVGAHRSVRTGTGTELAGIRAYQPGDRLRRINWRVSARTGELHVTTTRAEQDAGWLLVVDVLAEHGVSGGVDGAASSLDITVRAAAAVAEHVVRQGDRVALRPIGGRGRGVGAGAGQHHLQRLLGSLAELEPGMFGYEVHSRLELRVTAGTTVVVLTPLLVDAAGTAAATLLRRGLPVVVVDTLPTGTAPALDGPFGHSDLRLADLAWRMRRLEREQLVTALTALGCPVVPWTGSGSVDDVLRRFQRLAELPRVSTR